MPHDTFTTPEEDRMIEEAFADVLNGYLKSNHRKKVEIIEKAFKFAKEAHKGVRRRSGEPYIMHPIAVAKIASQEIGLGSTSICAALLHDVVEDTDYKVEDIEQLFGRKIAQLVSGLTKISGGIFGSQASAQAENFRKLLLTMSEDIRVVLIKMADRLHNMRTLGSMAPNKQYKIAGETLYIYAPLAHRLGLYSIKTELEDLAFKYEHPAEYERILKKIEQTAFQRDIAFENFSKPIRERLDALGIKYTMKARVKSVYSIWNKMTTKNIPFEEVYDLYAARIIIDCDDKEKENGLCWQVQGVIDSLYKFHPDRMRNWLGSPKANGYQALHVTAMGPDGNWVEVQIRSRRMDEIAEKGFAAHWKYKVGEGDEESELNAWLKTIKDILDNPEPNAMDFLDTLKLNLFASEIVVFTPKGELVTLPNNASVLDLAFELHSELGSKCIAGKVNHRLVPLSEKLKSGDQVEIITSQSAKPKEDWFAFLATAKAKTQLRKALSRLQQPDINKGQEILAEFLKQNELEENNDLITWLLGHFKVNTKDELYLALGREEIVLGEYVARQLTRSNKKSMLRTIFRPIFKSKKEQDLPGGEEGDEPPADPRPKINTKEVYELRYDGNTQNFKFAGCCAPIPGDEVLGFINEDGEVEVHSIDCPHAMKLKATYGPRILSTRWASGNGKFAATVSVEGIDRFGILHELIHTISNNLALNLRNLEIHAKDELFECKLEVLVDDADLVKNLCDAILNIKGVRRATRIFKDRAQA